MIEQQKAINKRSKKEIIIRTSEYDDNDQIQLCPHITISGKNTSEKELSEYIVKLAVHCNICMKDTVITILVN